MGPTGKMTWACGEKRRGGFGLTGVGKQQKKKNVRGFLLRGEAWEGVWKVELSLPFAGLEAKP